MQLGRALKSVNATIRGRLTVLALVAVAAFLLVSVGESIAVRSILHEVERDDISRRVHRTRRLFERLASTKANIVSEFSFWESTWRAEDSPQTPWARQFMRENFLEWLPGRYGEQLIELWSRDRNPVLRWTDSSLAGFAGSLNRQKLFDVADRQKLVGGYAATPRGLVLVASALVLHSYDSRLGGPSNGYLIAGRLLDSGTIAQVDDELQDHIRILPLLTGWPADSVSIETIVEGDSMITTFALNGFEGTPVAMISMASSRGLMQELSLWAHIVLAVTVMAGGLVLSLLWRAGARLVIRPLGEIATSLEQMQRKGELTQLTTIPPIHEWGTFVDAFNGTITAWQSSEKRYQVLFDQAADAYLLIDPEAEEILEANPAAALIAGIPRAALIGQPFRSAMPLEPSPENHGSYRLRRQDGSVLTVGMVTADLEIGGQRRQLASLRDLTQSEALSAQLRQAQKMEAVGSLAGGIAHDFNNLLGAILMASSSLRLESAGDPGLVESIDTIDQASRRAVELTRRLLSFARREHQRIVPVSVHDVVGNVVRLCERTFDRAIRIDFIAAPEAAVVSGDPGQLEQALLNLCINARDAMPTGGVLRIEVENRTLDASSALEWRDLNAGSFVAITVADTGLGLTTQAEKHLFEPFFTTKGQGKGTGLGLAMVYGIVKTHAGSIRAQSRPGRGVTFEILIPTGVGTIPAPVHRLVEKPATGTERLLVIDDEASLRSVVSRTLKQLGYSVNVAENGVKGIDLFVEDPLGVDLVLLDMVMPEMGGAETFRRLREIRADIPVLVCSGYSAYADRQEMMEAGAVGFLEKPFDTVDLAREVRGALDLFQK
ncbi:MAG: response regulator [Gemmatimonadota bacterium]